MTPTSSKASSSDFPAAAKVTPKSSKASSSDFPAAAKVTPKSSKASSSDFPPKRVAPKPTDIQMRHRQFIKDKLNDTNFQPGEKVQQRMKHVQKAWLAETASDSRVLGCGKCRYSRNGCLKCDPAKAKKAAKRIPTSSNASSSD